MGAFVGHHGLQVHHVAHDGVVAGDAHAAEHLTSVAGDSQGHVDVVALGHGDLGGRGAAFVLELTQAEGEQLGFGDLGDHFG